MKIDEFGNKRWRNEEGLLHRIDGPAVEYRDGGKEWFQNGKCHRENGPAEEYWNGYKGYWYLGKAYPEINNDAEWKRIVKLMVLE